MSRPVRSTARAARLVRVAAAVLPAVLAVAACSKDTPKPAPDEAKKTTPVPSDMVFNDFLPSSGEANLAVKVDGGIVEAGAVSAAPAANAFKVIEPGAEPRAPRKYTFTANRVDKRVLTMRQTMSQQGRTQEQPPLAMTVEFVPKEVKPTSTRFEMKVLKVELADKDKVDPRMAQAAAQELGAFAGLTASFDVSAHGEVGEVSLSGTDKMQRQGAAELLDAFSQFVELVLAPLPDEPIGQGAKWERTEKTKVGGIEQESKSTFELTQLTPEGGTILATIEKKVPKRPVPDPRMPPGTTMQVDATGKYTYALRFDRLATNVTGEQTQTVTIELAAQGREKQKVVQEMKISHEMTTPGGAQAAKPAPSAAPKK